MIYLLHSPRTTSKRNPSVGGRFGVCPIVNCSFHLYIVTDKEEQTMIKASSGLSGGRQPAQPKSDLKERGMRFVNVQLEPVLLRMLLRNHLCGLISNHTYNAP